MMRRLWLWIGLLAVVALMPFVVREPGPIFVAVTVGGEAVMVEAPATVGASLETAGVEPVDGVLLSAGTSTVLDASWDPATLLVGGDTVTVGEFMYPGQDLVVVDGTDEIEPTENVEMVVPYEIPDIEYELWRVGRDGLDDVVRGTVSGEIVSSTVVIAMQPARRVEDRVVVLTFDDGPYPEFTPSILATLDRFDLRAVFCVTGTQVTKHPDLVLAIRDAGHVLCNHTWDHPDLTTLDPTAIEEQIVGTSDAIERIAGLPPRFFRAPFGAVDDEVVAVTKANGMRILGWSVDSNDWVGGSAQAITDRVVTNSHPGAIVVLHDGGGDRTETVAALPGMLFRLIADRYGFALPNA